MDNRIQKGEETKERILKAALEIASTEGTRGLSAKKVADLAGVSKSNIFHHFASVDGILDVLLEGLCEINDDILSAYQPKTLEAFFQVIGESTFLLSGDSLKSYKVLFAYYYDVVFTLRQADELIKSKESFIQMIKEIVSVLEGIEISDQIAELIAIDIDGLGMHYMVEADSKKYLDLWQLKSQMYIKWIRQ